MLCPKCGQYNPEGVACPCGAPLLSSNPAVNVLKTLGSSGRFLTMAILATAIPLCAILAASGMSNMLAQLLYLLWERSAMDTDTFYQLAGMIQGMGVMSAVWASVPSILAALGLWLFYASCRNRKTGNVSTAGLTILKVLAYIFAIYVGICALFLVVCAIFVPFLVLSGAEVTYNGSSVDGTGAGVIVALVIFVFAVAAVVVGLTLAYFISAIRTINRLKAIATTGVPDNRLSRFFTGMLMVLGCLSGLGGLVNLFLNFFSGLGTLASAAMMILAALVLSRCRELMTALLYPPVQPAYPQGAPQNWQQPGPWAQPAAPEAQAAPQQPAPAQQEQPRLPPLPRRSPRSSPRTLRRKNKRKGSPDAFRGFFSLPRRGGLPDYPGRDGGPAVPAPRNPWSSKKKSPGGGPGIFCTQAGRPLGLPWLGWGARGSRSQEPLEQ